MDSKEFCKDLQTNGRACVMCAQNMHIGPEIPLVRLSEVREKCLDAVGNAEFTVWLSLSQVSLGMTTYNQVMYNLMNIMTKTRITSLCLANQKPEIFLRHA